MLMPLLTRTLYVASHPKPESIHICHKNAFSPNVVLCNIVNGQMHWKLTQITPQSNNRIGSMLVVRCCLLHAYEWVHSVATYITFAICNTNFPRNLFRLSISYNAIMRYVLHAYIRYVFSCCTKSVAMLYIQCPLHI